MSSSLAEPMPKTRGEPGRGKLFVLSGPSGSGKSTVIQRALEGLGLPVRLAVSVTTRPPRRGEIDGQHYHFWTPERFDRAVAAGEFLEWADVYGNRYGTLRSEVDPRLAQGESVLLEIDIQGGLQIRRNHAGCILIFISTSDQKAYEARLRQRRTDSEAALAKRLEAAQREIQVGQQCYDYQVLNDQLESAVAELRRLLRLHTVGDAHVG